jgi:hypothetical protein
VQGRHGLIPFELWPSSSTPSMASVALTLPMASLPLRAMDGGGTYGRIPRFPVGRRTHRRWVASALKVLLLFCDGVPRPARSAFLSGMVSSGGGVGKSRPQLGRHGSPVTGSGPAWLHHNSDGDVIPYI